MEAKRGRRARWDERAGGEAVNVERGRVGGGGHGVCANQSEREISAGVRSKTDAKKSSVEQMQPRWGEKNNPAERRCANARERRETWEKRMNK